MRYFAVKDFKKFQHYKDRSPQWIKLYNSVLENYEFCALPDMAKSHLLLIWLLASRMDNRIPYDAKWVTSKIAANTPVDLDLLLEAGFIVEHEPEIAHGKREEWPSRYIKPEVKAAVMERDGGKCRRCPATENLEFDRIVPTSQGGTGEKENIQLLCRKCNRKKRAEQMRSPVCADAEQVATQDFVERSLEREEESREETEQNPAAPANEDFAFVGETIRLNRKDYDNWKSICTSIADFNAELHRIDMVLRGKEKWFTPAMNMLFAKNEKLKAERKRPKTEDELLAEMRAERLGLV